MSAMRIVGIAIILIGVLSLAYGGFTYTSDTHKADVGPIHLSVKEKQTVNIPVWAGIGAIVLGGLVFVGGKKNGGI
ncbi:MAG: hypothetical protein ABI304_03530 [Rudaea sp.]